MSGAPVQQLRVIIADDDPLVRRLLTQVLEQADGIAVVGSCADGSEVPALLRSTHADVLLLDVRMRQMSGIEVVRLVSGFPRPPACVMVTAYDEEGAVLDAVAAGAVGFLLKDEDPEALVAAVRAAARGDSPMSARSTAHLQRLVRAGTGDAHRVEAQRQVAQLSPRERTVALAVARGDLDREIAAELFLGVATVKSALAAVHARWGTRNRTQIATIIARSGADLLGEQPGASAGGTV